LGERKLEGDKSEGGLRGRTRCGRRKRAWKRPFWPPRAFRRGEMARFSYRTDIRPVQEPRTKSYIHASSHYASLSRLGSAVRRAGRRRKKRGPAEDAAGERKKCGERRGGGGGGVRGRRTWDCTLFTTVPSWRAASEKRKAKGTVRDASLFG